MAASMAEDAKQKFEAGKISERTYHVIAEQSNREDKGMEL